MLQQLARTSIVVVLALALSACSAIELRQRMVNATATGAEPVAAAQATAAELEAMARALAARATESAVTVAALETAAAGSAATATPDAATDSAFTSAEAVVFGSVPIDNDRLNTIAALAFDAAGQLLVSTRAGEIYRLRDADADGLADETELIYADEAEALGQVAGMITRGDSILLVNGGRLSRLDDSDGDGSFDTVTHLAESLPAGETPLLASNAIAQAPDGRLFSVDLNTGEILLLVLNY